MNTHSTQRRLGRRLGSKSHREIRWKFRSLKSASVLAFSLLFQLQGKAALQSYIDDKIITCPPFPLVLPPGFQQGFKVEPTMTGKQSAIFTRRDGTKVPDSDHFSKKTVLPFNGGSDAADSEAEKALTPAYGHSAASGNYTGPIINPIIITASVSGAAFAFAGDDVVSAAGTATSKSLISYTQGQIEPSVREGRKFVPLAVNHSIAIEGSVDDSNPAVIKKTHNGGVKDPVVFSFFDSNTKEVLLTDTIFELEASVVSGDENGELIWDSTTGIFSVNASSADFSILLDSPYLLENGLLNLSIRGGLVVESIATGIFDGVLPPVGTVGDFSVPLGEITLEILADAPILQNRLFGMELDSSTIGTAVARESVPEQTPTVILLGVSLCAMVIGLKYSPSPSNISDSGWGKKTTRFSERNLLQS